MKTDTRGRSKVGLVARNDNSIPTANAAMRSNVSIIFAFVFLYFVVGLTFFDKLPVWVLGLYFLASIASFIAYAFDKSAARNNQWRTQESTLHLFALVGGWPGALIAQRLLRHKTKKQSFQVVFWAIVALNCGVLGWLFSSSGADVLRSFLGTP
jgi:uncharacterized membrane protein YsdA (DUF1294 family)